MTNRILAGNKVGIECIPGNCKALRRVHNVSPLRSRRRAGLDGLEDQTW